MKKIFFLKSFLILSVCMYAPGNLSFAATGNTNKTNLLFSNTTDYFRSVATGLWSATSTWESSPDNSTWLPATLTPTAAAATISIRNTHTVTVSNNQNMDEVIIESGGILFHSSSALTINDGFGDDVIVQSGGVFTLASDANPPVFSVSTASVNINSGGILRLSATGLTFPSPTPGVNTSNYIYQHPESSLYINQLQATPFHVEQLPEASNIFIAPASSCATNSSRRSDPSSAQCRSSSTSSSGRVRAALFKKAVIESNRRKRACRGSSNIGGCPRSGRRWRTSGTTSAISAAPALISKRSCSESRSRT